MNASNYKFCPRCKSDLRNGDEFLECQSCGLKIYKNSSPTASVLIVKDDRVLLARRGIEPRKGDYDVVGGFLKYGEDPATGVLREAEEETGLKIKIMQMLGIYMDTYGEGGEATLNIYYIGEILSGEMKPQDDVSSLEWIQIESLPKPAFPSQEEVFKDFRTWYFGRGAEN